jgi:cation diffusion facilitator CzcD-associated flavoprotein CzcO
MPARDALANFLRRVLPERVAYRITRWKNVLLQTGGYRLSRVLPGLVQRLLLGHVRRNLGRDYDIGTHFTPGYRPWDQRLCLLPDADLFKALKGGKAVVVTGEIETFTEAGIVMKSGRELAADIIVTATGLELVVLGKIGFTVDGKAVDFSTTYSYKGTMFSDVPNLVATFGYVNASWTLRADLIAEYTCRLIRLMDDKAYRSVTPRLREAERNMPARHWIDIFSSNYFRRAMHAFPRQGDHAPWINPQLYGRDRKMMLHSPIEDDTLEFCQ